MACVGRKVKKIGVNPEKEIGQTGKVMERGIDSNGREGEGEGEGEGGREGDGKGEGE